MTRLRTGFLSDQSVLDRCPEENSIPFNKMNLAARSGAKISFPQKAGFMYQNLPIPHAQKESLINEFVLRSQKQLPLKISAMQYSTLSLDKVGALTTQTQNGSNVSNDVLQSLMNSLNQSQQQLNQSQTNLIQQTKHLQVSQHMHTFVGLRDRNRRNNALINLYKELDANGKKDVWTVFSATDENDFMKTITDINYTKYPQKDAFINLTEMVLSDIVNSDATIDIGDILSNSRLLGSPS